MNDRQLAWARKHRDSRQKYAFCVGDIIELKEEWAGIPPGTLGVINSRSNGSYSITFYKAGRCAWFDDHQLSLIERNRV